MSIRSICLGLCLTVLPGEPGGRMSVEFFRGRDRGRVWFDLEITQDHIDRALAQYGPVLYDPLEIALMDAGFENVSVGRGGRHLHGVGWLERGGEWRTRGQMPMSGEVS